MNRPGLVTIAQRTVSLPDPQDCTDNADSLALLEALFDALTARAIGGAVIDVWWNGARTLPPGGEGPERWPSRYRYDQLDNVGMTPHSSSLTEAADARAAAQAAANLDALALGLPLQNVVRNATR